MNVPRTKFVSYTLTGVIGGFMAVYFSGCAQAAKTAADAGKAVSCVVGDWGKPVSTIAVDCFDSVEQLAVDAVADEEYLLQKNGAKPTMAYLADARVQQRVLARRAGTGPLPTGSTTTVTVTIVDSGTAFNSRD